VFFIIRTNRYWMSPIWITCLFLVLFLPSNHTLFSSILIQSYLRRHLHAAYICMQRRAFLSFYSFFIFILFFFLSYFTIYLQFFDKYFFSINLFAAPNYLFTL